MIVEVTARFASKHVFRKLVTTTTRNGICSLTPCIPPARLERLRFTSVFCDNGEGGCTPGISFSVASLRDLVISVNWENLSAGNYSQMFVSSSTAYAPTRSIGDRALAIREKDSNPIAAKLRADGSVCFQVLDASMFPSIRPGDLVFARKFSYEQAWPGDVVLFERRGRLFVHRVIRGGVSRAGATQHRDLITKGDALDSEDEPVTRAEFLGRVIRVHRGNRHIDMESMGRVMIGRLIARVSRTSFALYRPVRVVKHLLFG